MKRKVTDSQLNFLLNFFENEKYAGWKNIAISLIEKGECVVAGETCIWLGGIGNFIDTTKHDDYYGCLIYKFDLGGFLNSEYLKENLNNTTSNLLDNLIKH